MRDVEQVIAGLKSEAIREITKENARPEAQLAWYWTYKPPSVLDNLRQCQEEAGKSQGGAAPPNRDPER